MHHTKDKGDLAVAHVIADLMAHNIRVCLPISEHLPFDLVAVMPDMTTLRRVQVKYRSDWNSDGTIRINLRSNYYDSKKIYSRPINRDHVDCFAIYSPETRKTYYVRNDEIPVDGRTFVLRLKPARNHQTFGVHFAENYVDPHRIAACSELASSAPLLDQDTLQELAVVKLSVELMEQGWYVLLPYSRFLPFSCLALDPTLLNIIRVDVSYQRVFVKHRITKPSGGA